MKKSFLAVLVLSAALSSCAPYNVEKLNLNFSLNNNSYNLSRNRVVELKVVDDRKEKDLIGTKRVGKKVVEIKTSKKLTDLIEDKIFQDLEKNGFVMWMSDRDLSDKLLEIRIVKINYSAYREFFTGISKIEVALKITAKNAVNKASYSNTKTFVLEKTHFIMPLIATDEKTVEYALQQALDAISSDQKLLDFLQK